ncbi:MAG: sensor histidine kinase [Caulobacteraceae bacterium]
MIVNEIKSSKLFMTSGFILIGIGLIFPYFTQVAWLNVILKIREAINAGDSGHLILASASASFLYALQSTFLFLGTMLATCRIGYKRLEISLMSLIAVIALHWVNSLIFDLPWEPIATILALCINLFLFEKIFGETNSILHVLIVAVQVFFAFQWLNIMPMFSAYRIGESDIPYSIKIAGIYLQASSVLNFTGFAFFLPFIFSAFITAMLFISFSKNMQIMRENYAKESELRNIKEKALKNRIYQEINSLVHDLKTPLVTIHGLSSLLASSKDQGKLEEYSVRIEGSITKMNEMISSFLYETSRQRLKANELISYIRAQLPLEDDTIKIDINMEENLPDIYVNKIRVARAVINIMENAIIVPCKNPFKHILFEVKTISDGLNIKIQDNGIGIKESDLPRIWEVGYSTNNTSGLGLPFAKQIIEDNGGSISISSQPEQGTTVNIFLPSNSGFRDGSN